MPAGRLRNTKRSSSARKQKRKPLKKFFCERISLDENDVGRLRRHIARYRFAASAIPKIEESTILDVGCGVGYGSNILAKKAKRVVGLDISEEAINIARTKYGKRKNLVFLKADATKGLPFPDNHFSAVCCIEALEHFRNPIRVLNEIKRVLKPNGIAIITTPAKELVSPFRRKPRNPHHVREFTLNEVLSLLRENFGEVEVYGQQVLSSKGAILTKKLFSFFGLERFRVFRNIFLGKGSERVVKITVIKKQRPVVLVAVCKNPKKGSG